MKKTYSLLPIHTNQDLFIKDRPSDQNFKLSKNSLITLMNVWNKLLTIRHLKFSASSKGHYQSGWDGQGTGIITIKKNNMGAYVFYEKGTWENQQKQELNFTNIFRWTLNKASQTISLEHLRYGIDTPVFLFDLSPSASDTLTSVDSHLCGKDLYSSQLKYDKYRILLKWRIIGAKKDETIKYEYF